MHTSNDYQYHVDKWKIAFGYTEEYSLHHFFFVNGNGYDWVNGYLTDFDAKTGQQHREHHKNWCLNNRIKYVEPESDIRTLPKNIYPLCKYACILHIPFHCNSDWLQAAQKAITLAYTLELTESDTLYLLFASNIVNAVLEQNLLDYQRTIAVFQLYETMSLDFAYQKLNSLIKN